MPNFHEPNDYLSRSTILRGVSSHRVSFDPANEAHCASLKKFLETGNWGGVMFYPEYPYMDVPTYVLAKFASHQLGVVRKSVVAQFEDARARNAPKEDTVELIEIPQE